MSKPLTIQSVTINRSETGALPTVAHVYLSNGTKLDELFGFQESTELMIKRIANRVIELNQVAYWHPLTPGLMNALVKFKQAVIDKGENSIHLLEDMQGKSYELTPHEWNNATKLRFHALIAKDKHAGAGYWLLTHRGSEFLKGNLSIPAKVKTSNNEVVDHDDIHKTIDEVMGSIPFFDTIDTVQMERSALEFRQSELAL